MTTMADPNSLAGLAQQTLQQQQQPMSRLQGANLSNVKDALTHYQITPGVSPFPSADRMTETGVLAFDRMAEAPVTNATAAAALTHYPSALTAAQQPQQQTQLPPMLSGSGGLGQQGLGGGQQNLNGPQSFNQQQPPTLPPQIGQQKFGDSGIGSLGGSGGQSNVSLNLQGSATMNPQGANQNRGYPGFDFNPGASGAGASGQMRLAKGGAIPAPAQQSRGIAALGRGGDTQLVHMTPGEVRGLQQLALAHGGSLTINPHTGLVEAGFLSSMLPMLIGAGLTFVSGGALSPVAAAMMTGAGYGVATGSLKKGLMAGLGAYGGANLGAGLGEMGAEALATTPEAYATTLGVEGAGAGSQAAMLAEQTKNFGLQGLQATAEGAIPNSSIQLPKYADMDMAQRAQAMQKGLGSVNPFSDTFDKTAATDFLGKNKMPLASAFAGPAMEAMKPQSMTPMKPEPDQYDRELARYHLAPNYQAYVPPRPNPYYSAVYAAKGGDVSRMAGGGKTRTTPLPRKATIPSVGIAKDIDRDTATKDAYTAAILRLKKQASGANLTPYTPAKTAIRGLGDIGPSTSMMANGGIAELPSEYAAGGKLLQGPGDGMSDSIPAVIKGPRPQRAALAQGEFVVPADVVSHLGNGSTDAGAKRLYAMMNNIRKARTGTKKQGKQINAAHFMPA
jgi:hypothetical protein